MGRERGGEKKKTNQAKATYWRNGRVLLGEGKSGMAFLVRVSFLFFFFLYVFWEKIIKYCFFQRFFKTSLGIN